MSQIFQAKIRVEQVYTLDIEAPDGYTPDDLIRVLEDKIEQLKARPETLLSEGDSLTIDFLCWGAEYADTEEGTGTAVSLRTLY